MAAAQIVPAMGKKKRHQKHKKEKRQYVWGEQLRYARDRCMGSAKWTTVAIVGCGLIQVVLCGVIVSLVAAAGISTSEVLADEGTLEYISTYRLEEQLACLSSCDDFPDEDVKTECTLCKFLHSTTCLPSVCNAVQQLSIIEVRAGCNPACMPGPELHGYSVPLGQQSTITGFTDHIWTAWVLMTDPTTMAGAAGSIERLISAGVGFAGFFFFAVVVGFVVDAIQRLYESLKAGVGTVAEKNHIVIVGWTDRTLEVVRELTLAADSEGGTRIVVLAEQEKAHIKSEIDAGIGPTNMHGSKLAIRTGVGTNMKDLQMVGITNAKCVIILGDPECPDKADSFVLRTVLCMKGLKYQFTGHVVAEMRDHENEQLVRLIGGACMETVIYTDITDDMLLMCMREPGLALVYQSILGFEGDEFYLERWEELDGIEWCDIQGYFPDAIPVGFQTPKGVIKLNPEKDTEMPEGSRLLVIAEDDDSYKPLPPLPMLNKGSIPKYTQDTQVEDILIVGWRDDIAEIINQLDKMVQKGSTLHILCELHVDERIEDLLDQGLDVHTQLKHLQLEHYVGNPSQRRYLEKLPLPSIGSCLVLGDEQSAMKDGGMESDSTTLACVLLLRDIQCQYLARKDMLDGAKKKGDATAQLMDQGLDMLRDPDEVAAEKAQQAAEDEEEEEESDEEEEEELDDKQALEMKFWNQGMETMPIICQIESSTTRSIIAGNNKVETSADFVYSNEVLSKVLAMVAERREMKSVLMELLGPFGAGLHVKDIRRYAHPGEHHSFYSLATRVNEHDEILIGYREKGRKVQINPDHKDFARQWEEVELIVMSGRHKQLWEGVMETKVGTKKAIANKKHWVHLRLVEEERKDAREKEKAGKKEKKGTQAMLVEQGLLDLDELAETNYGCGEDGLARQHLLMQSLEPHLTEGHLEHGERIIMEGGKLKTKGQGGDGKKTIAQLLAMEEEEEEKFGGYGEDVDQALNKLLLQVRVGAIVCRLRRGVVSLSPCALRPASCLPCTPSSTPAHSVIGRYVCRLWRSTERRPTTTGRWAHM
jgi:hypothetical protein